MAEWRPTDAELDSLVESMLAEGPLAPAPRNLHSKVNERIRLAALEQKERVRFRNALLTGLMASVGIVLTAGSLLAWTNFSLLLDHGVSGGLGFLDYYTHTFQIPWPVRMDGLFLACCLALGIGTVWVGLQPLVRQGGLRQDGVGRRPGVGSARLARTR